MYGTVDVVVADGYSGNLILKSLEGAMLATFQVLKNTFNSKLQYKLGALILKKSFIEIKELLDYRNSALAWVVGLNKLAIKTHGSSDEKSYTSAFKQIYESLENDFIKKLKEEF